MKSKILFLLCLVSSIALAEDANPIKLAMQTMEKSKIVYSVKELKSPIPEPDRSNMLTIQVYREKTSKGYVLRHFDITGEAKKEFDKAEVLFNAKRFEDAREAYKRVMLFNPKAVNMMTFVAQTYGLEQKWDKAELWYKKSIEANYLDYLAHWLLADIYLIKGEKKKSLDEISIAKVLNRNNPRLEEKRKKIYAANGLDSSSFIFNPQTRISQGSDGTVTIEADSIWMIYSLIRAAWMYEPDYKKKAAASANPKSMIAKDCLFGLIPNIETRRLSSKTLARYDKALMGGHASEFIYYEMLLPDNPTSAFYLEPKEIEQIKDYLIFINKK